MKWSIVFLVVGFCAALPPNEQARNLSVVELHELSGGQELGDPVSLDLNRKCAHIEAGWGENPCEADEFCPTDVSECSGVHEYSSTATFWKCIPWLFERKCTVSETTATCLFSVPCGIFNGECGPHPTANGTWLASAPTSCSGL